MPVPTGEPNRGFAAPEGSPAAEGGIEGAHDSQKSRKAIQAAFSEWWAEEGTPFAQISWVLAMSVD